MVYSSGSSFQGIVTALAGENLFEGRALGTAEKEVEIRFALMLAFMAVLRADYESWITLLQTLSQDQKKKKVDEEAALLFLQSIQLPDARTDKFTHAYHFLAHDEAGWLFKNENLLKIKQAARYILQHPHKFEHLKEIPSVGSSRAENGLLEFGKKQIRQDFDSLRRSKSLTDAPLFSASLHLAVSKEESLKQGLKAILPVLMHDLLVPNQYIFSFQKMISLEQAMLLSLMFECANQKNNKKVLELVRTYGAYLFEETDFDKKDVIKLLNNANRTKIQERVEFVLRHPEQYRHLFSLLWRSPFNHEEFVASFNEATQRAHVPVTPRASGDELEVRRKPRRGKTPGRPANTGNREETTARRHIKYDDFSGGSLPSTPRDAASNDAPLPSTLPRAASDNGPLPSTLRDAASNNALLPGTVDEIDWLRIDRAHGSFNSSGEGWGSSSEDESSPSMNSSVERSSAGTPSSVINWPKECPPQAPENRKNLKQALDDYAAHLQTLVWMMEFNLEDLGSTSERDRLASFIKAPYVEVFLCPKESDDKKTPLKSLKPAWEKFEGALKGKPDVSQDNPHASFLAKVKGSEQSGFFYYLGHLIREGNAAGTGAMKKYRKRALEQAIKQLKNQHARLSEELKRLFEGQALEVVNLTHRFTCQLMQAVHDDEISLYKHDNRRLEQIKRMMSHPIRHFHSWAISPTSATTLIEDSKKFTLEFKQEMFKVEDEIRRDWGRKSDLRRIVRGFVDPDQQFDLIEQRMVAIKGFIDSAETVPDELFVEHNYYLLDQALHQALLSKQFLYDDSRIERYLKHLNSHLPAAETSIHFMQELICRLISEELGSSVAIDDMDKLRKMLSHIQAAFKLPWMNTRLSKKNTSQNFSDEEVDAYVRLCLKAKEVDELYRLTKNGLMVGDECIGADKIKEKIWCHLADYPITDVKKESVEELIVSIAPVFLNEKFINIREKLYKVRLIYQYGSDEQKRTLDEKFIFALNNEQSIEAFKEKFNLFRGIHTEGIDQVFSSVLWQSEKTHVKAQTHWYALCDSLINQKVTGLSADKQHELASIIAAHLLPNAENEKIENQLAAIRDAKKIVTYLKDERSRYWVQEPSNEMGERVDLDLSSWQTRVNKIIQYARLEDKTLLVEAFTSRKNGLLNFPLVKKALSENRLELLVNVGAAISSDSLACLSVLESKIPVTHNPVFQGLTSFVTQFSQENPAYFYFTLHDLLEIASANKNDKGIILQQVQALRSSTSNHSLHQILNLVEKVAKQDQLIFLSSVTQEMVNTLNEINHQLLTMEQEHSATLLEAITAFQIVLNNAMKEEETDKAIQQLENCLERDFNASAKILLRQMLDEFKQELQQQPLDIDKIKALKNKLPFDRTVKLHNIATYLTLIKGHAESSAMASTTTGVSEDQLYNETDIKSVLTLSGESEPGLSLNAIREAADYLLDYYLPGSYILMGRDEVRHPDNLAERDDRDRLVRRLWLCDRVVRHYHNAKCISSDEKAKIERNRIHVELHFLRHAIHHVKTDRPSRVDSHLLLLQAAYPRTQDEPGKYDEFFEFRLNNRTKPACRPAYEALAAKYYCDLQAKLNNKSLDDFLSSLSQQVNAAFAEQDFLTAARLVKTFYLVKDRLEDKSRWLAVCPDFETSLLQNLNELAFVHDAKIQDLLDSQLANVVEKYAKHNEALKNKALSLIEQCQSSLAFSKAMTGELERVSCNMQTMQQAVFLPETPLFLAEAVRNQWLAKVSSLREKSSGDAYVEFQKAIEAIIINTSDVPKLKEAVERFNEESSWAVLQERIALLHCPQATNKPLTGELTSWGVKEAEALIGEYKGQQSLGTRKKEYRFAEALNPSEIVRTVGSSFTEIMDSILIKNPSFSLRGDWIPGQFPPITRDIACTMNRSQRAHESLASLVHLRQLVSVHYSMFKRAQVQCNFKDERHEQILKEWSLRLAALTYPFAEPLWDTFDSVMSVYSTSAQQQVQTGHLASEENSFYVGLQIARTWQSTVFLPDYPEVKLAWEQGFHTIWLEICMFLTQAKDVLEGRCPDTPSSIRRTALLRLLGLCVGWEGKLPGGELNLRYFMELFSLACDHPGREISQDVLALQNALETYKRKPGVILSKQAKWFYVLMHSSTLVRKLALDSEDHPLFIECCHYIDASMQSLPRFHKILDQLAEVGEKVPREELWKQWPVWCANPDNPILLKIQSLLSPPKSVRELNYLYSYLQDRRISSDIKEWMQEQVLLVTNKPCWKEFILQENGTILFHLLELAGDDASKLKDWAIECFNSIQEVSEEVPRALLREKLLYCLKKENHPVVDKMKELFFPLRSIEDLNFMCSCILKPDIASPIKIMMQRRMLSPSVKGKDFLDSFFMQQSNSPLPGLLNLAKTSELKDQKEWAIKFLLSAKEMNGESWLNLVAAEINDDEGVVLQLLKCKILISNRMIDDAIKMLTAILSKNGEAPSRFVEEGAELELTYQQLLYSTVREIVSLIPSLDVSREMDDLAREAFENLRQTSMQSNRPQVGGSDESRPRGRNPYLGQVTCANFRDNEAPMVSSR